jgi:hypothetical protein
MTLQAFFLIFGFWVFGSGNVLVMAGRPKRRQRLEEAGLWPPDENKIPERHKFSDDDRDKSKAVLREKRLLQRAGAIRREEEIQEALKRNAHRHVAVQDRLLNALERLAERAESGSLEKDDVPLLKMLLAEDRANLDRVFGKTTQRQQIDQHSTSTHVDVAELMKAARALPSGFDSVGDDVVLDALEVVDDDVG